MPRKFQSALVGPIMGRSPDRIHGIHMVQIDIGCVNLYNTFVSCSMTRLESTGVESQICFGASDVLVADGGGESRR